VSFRWTKRHEGKFKISKSKRRGEWEEEEDKRILYGKGVHSRTEGPFCIIGKGSLFLADFFFFFWNGGPRRPPKIMYTKYIWREGGYAKIFVMYVCMYVCMYVWCSRFLGNTSLPYYTQTNSDTLNRRKRTSIRSGSLLEEVFSLPFLPAIFLDDGVTFQWAKRHKGDWRFDLSKTAERNHVLKDDPSYISESGKNGAIRVSSLDKKRIMVQWKTRYRDRHEYASRVCLSKKIREVKKSFWGLAKKNVKYHCMKKHKTWKPPQYPPLSFKTSIPTDPRVTRSRTDPPPLWVRSADPLDFFEYKNTSPRNQRFLEWVKELARGCSKIYKIKKEKNVWR
jgi:hypothetical protein